MAPRSDEWRIDLHLHSTFSPDGEMTPAELVRTAVENGLRGVALTDHNSTSGVRQARDAALKYPGFLVVPAMEVSSSDGHVIALGVEEPVAPGLTVVETVDRIRAAGALPVASHPFRNFTGMDEDLIRSAKFEALEVLNGRSPKRKNLRACRLAMSLKLGLSAGSDGHRTSEVGRCYIIVEGDPGGAEGLLEMIRKGNTRAWGRSASFIDVARTAAKIGRELIRRRGKRI